MLQVVNCQATRPERLGANSYKKPKPLTLSSFLGSSEARPLAHPLGQDLGLAEVLFLLGLAPEKGANLHK